MFSIWNRRLDADGEITTCSIYAFRFARCLACALAFLLLPAHSSFEGDSAVGLLTIGDMPERDKKKGRL